MKENGDVNPHTSLMGVRRMDDFDIKDIQQKKQQAEQKRLDNTMLTKWADHPIFSFGMLWAYN